MAIASGCDRCGPTWMSFTFVAEARSITDTVPSDSFDTSPYFPSREIAAPYG